MHDIILFNDIKNITNVYYQYFAQTYVQYQKNSDFLQVRKMQ